MNTDLGHLAVDSLIDDLDCCTGSCDQGRECPRRAPKKRSAASHAVEILVGAAIGLALLALVSWPR